MTHPGHWAARTGAALAFLLAANLTSAVEWSPAVRLNDPDTHAWFPEVATDRAGQAHVVWSDAVPRSRAGPGADRVVHCSIGAAGCTKVLPIALRPAAGDGVYVTRPALAIDAGGTAHLLWRRKGVIAYQAAYVGGSLEASAWTPARKLGGEPGSYTALAADRRGRLHAAWAQGTWRGDAEEREAQCDGCSEIMYSRSDDGGIIWSPVQNISDSTYGSEKPHFAFGSDDTVYLAWEEGKDAYMGKGRIKSSMVAASTDGGRTWARPVELLMPNDTPQSIAIGVDAADRVVVVWQQVAGEGVFTQWSDDRGQTWSAPLAVADVRTRRPELNKYDDYDIAADAAGHLHLVLVGRPERRDAAGGQHVFHLEWDGTAWQEPTSLFHTNGGAEWPRIAVGNGNVLHAVWFERPRGFEFTTPEKGGYAVYYARSHSAAPHATPVVWPPPTPRRIGAADISRAGQIMAAVVIAVAVMLAARRAGW